MKPVSLILVFTLMFCGEALAESYNIDSLRIKQQQEVDKLHHHYKKLAQKPGADQAKLFHSYGVERQAILQRYKDIDLQRHKIINQTLNKYGKQHIKNTGSMPATVGADVDYFAKTMHGYNGVRGDWEKRGDKIKDNGYCLVNESTDEVIWKPDHALTENERKRKKWERDAYITHGGQKSTGVRATHIKSSDSGAGLDPMRKLLSGIRDGNLKDVGKSLVKITTQADGRNVFVLDDDGLAMQVKKLDSSHIEQNELLQQASKLKSYHDGTEAGITSLSDSFDTEAKKLDQFQRRSVEMALEKQAQLDVADRRKQRYTQALIESLPQNSETRQAVEERLRNTQESNKLAREQVNADLRELNYDQQLVSEAEIEHRERVEYEERQKRIEQDKQEILESYAARQQKKQPKNQPTLSQEIRNDMKGKIKSLKTKSGAASFLVSAYHFNESLKNIKQQGGNDFIKINKDDSPMWQNFKAFLGAGIDGSAFGGGWSSGRRADLEEEQRIKKAIAEGKTVNEYVSYARSTFWGLAYTVKDTVLGSVEFAKEKLVGLDREIKDRIKDSVQRKYATKFQQETEALLQNRPAQNKNSQQVPPVIKEPVRPISLPNKQEEQLAAQQQREEIARKQAQAKQKLVEDQRRAQEALEQKRKLAESKQRAEEARKKQQQLAQQQLSQDTHRLNQCRSWKSELDKIKKDFNNYQIRFEKMVGKFGRSANTYPKWTRLKSRLGSLVAASRAAKSKEEWTRIKGEFEQTKSQYNALGARMNKMLNAFKGNTLQCNKMLEKIMGERDLFDQVAGSGSWSQISKACISMVDQRRRGEQFAKMARQADCNKFGSRLVQNSTGQPGNSGQRKQDTNSKQAKATKEEQSDSADQKQEPTWAIVEVYAKRKSNNNKCYQFYIRNAKTVQTDNPSQYTNNILATMPAHVAAEINKATDSCSLPKGTANIGFTMAKRVNGSFGNADAKAMVGRSATSHPWTSGVIKFSNCHVMCLNHNDLIAN